MGLVHVAAVGSAIGLYLSSWMARRRGLHGTGVGVALAGASGAGSGAYLGGHLAAARNVGSHHSAFDKGPLDDRPLATVEGG